MKYSECKTIFNTNRSFGKNSLHLLKSGSAGKNSGAAENLLMQMEEKLHKIWNQIPAQLVDAVKKVIREYYFKKTMCSTKQRWS